MCSVLGGGVCKYTCKKIEKEANEEPLPLFDGIPSTYYFMES